MNKIRKIAIIGVYYGKFPAWIEYWLKSCEENKNIDFFLVTDETRLNIPENVKIINMTLKELKELIEKKLDMKVCLEKVYKICDYRPAYGIIFNDYLQKYDYWGHCDFDMIFGDIEKFINEYHIEKYDKFLHLGHLAVYKNNDNVNSYFKMNGSRCGNYKKIFTSNKNFAFDEMGGIYSIFKYNKLPIFDKRIFAEIKTFHKRFRVSKCDKNYRHQIFYWENGKIYRAYKKGNQIQLQEYIYIHFRRKLPISNENINNIKSFYITNQGFIPKVEGKPSLEEIEKYNFNPGVINENFETIKFCIKNFKKLPIKLKEYMYHKIFKK